MASQKLFLLVLVALQILTQNGCVTAESPAQWEIAFTPGLSNQRIHRSIDLSGHVENQALSLEVTNQAQSPVHSYLHPIPAQREEHFAFAQAYSPTVKRSHMLQTSLVRIRQSSLPEPLQAESGLVSERWIRIHLPKPLQPGDSVHLVLQLAFVHTQRPVPEEIRQRDPQFVVYETESRFVLSAYPTAHQVTEITLHSSEVLSHTRRGASTSELSSQRKLTYGPFEDVPAGKVANLRLHYKNNAPFITFRSLVKEVKISHYGTIEVEEHYRLFHSGAKLTGGYSRLDYEHGLRRGDVGASFHSMQATLPPSASNIYYRDDIGNVSTSVVRHRTGKNPGVHFEVKPRFPMFGGWKTNFYYGYNVPTSEFLGVSESDGSVFVASVDFGTPFSGAAVDEFELRVVLPEFSSDIEWEAPFPVDSADLDTRVTYLDTSGRPVLVLRKRNVVPQHHRFQAKVKYRFSEVLMLKKPFLVAAVVMGFFLLCLAWSRFELGLSKTTAVPVKLHQD